MTQRLASLSLAVALALSGAPACADIGNIAENKGKELVGEIIGNPAGLFFDWQQDMETLSPLPPGKWIGFNYHIGQFFPVPIGLPLPDPTSAGNLSGKLRLHAEGRWAPGVPQIDLIGGVWDFLPASSLAEKDSLPTDAETKLKDVTMKGKYLGVVLTSSLEPRVRLFWGFKKSTMDISLELNKDTELLGSKVRTIKTGLEDKFLFAGLEHPTSKGRYWTVALSYGIDNKLPAAKVSWYGRVWEMGLNIYPEGIGLYPFPGVPIHPTIGFHLNF